MLTSKVDDEKVMKSLCDQRLPPRLRAFVVQAFNDATGWTVDDLYRDTKLDSKNQKRLYLKQINHLVGVLNTMQGKNEDKWSLQLGR
jgi:hypothetical protein